MFSEPYALALIVPLSILWWLYSRTNYLRLLIVVVFVLAIAQPMWVSEQTSRRITLLVDRSLSTRGEALARAEQVATALAKQQNLDLNIVVFGQSANLVARQKEAIEGLRHLSLQDESNLLAGLNLVTGLASSDQSRSILLISDGLYTGQDPLTLIPELRHKNIQVNYWPLTLKRPKDSAITQVFYEPQVTVNQPFTVTVDIYSAQAQTVPLVFKQQSTTLSSQMVDLVTGMNQFSFSWRIPKTGLQAYQLVLQLPEDSVPENNLAQLAIEAHGAQRILLLNQSGQATALATALQSTGLGVDISNGKQAFSSLQLRQYAVVVLENMPLTQLYENVDKSIQHYVRQFGGGLLITGGRSSYAMGGYYRSHLENLLPVTLERHQELLRSQLALGIVLDRSGSMNASAGGGFKKMDLANRAAVEALALLAEQDDICVMAVDSTAHQVVDLQAVGSGVVQEAIAKRILSVESQGGGIYVYEGLRQIAACLLRSGAPSRHIVLFADAADAEQPGKYKELIASWRQSGGTISVVGLGKDTDSDAKFLKDIAKRGNGRVFFTVDPQNLPRIFAQDVIQVARKTFVQQPTPILPARGMLALNWTAANIPDVGGYNLSYLADEASLILMAKDKHKAPLVAGWQRGSGKVMAVLFEADGPHTGSFAQWHQYKIFFRQIVEWLKKAPNEAGIFADLRLKGRRADVIVEFDPNVKAMPQQEAYIIRPGEHNPLKLPLHWQGPGRLSASFDLGSDGIYHGLVAIPESNTIVPLPPRVLPYSPEFSLHQHQQRQQVMQALASATGGAVFTHIDTLTEAATMTSRQFRQLSPWLEILLIILILLEIGWRRGVWQSILMHLGVQQIGISWKQYLQKTARRPSTMPPTNDQTNPQIQMVDDPLLVAKNKAKKKF